MKFLLTVLLLNQTLDGCNKKNTNDHQTKILISKQILLVNT